MPSILLIVLFSIFVSCEKDTPDTLPLHHGKLKRKLIYEYIGDTIPRVISEYEYDLKERLVKIQDTYSTQLFKYNQNDELIRKYNYQVDGSGTTLSDTTWYKYLNGNLVYEETIPLQESNNTLTHQIKYEYENSKLYRKKEYIDHRFDEMTVYEYKNDLCSKEIHYPDSLVSGYYWFTDYVYDDNHHLAVSSLRNSYNWLLMAGYYFYDDDGNLVWEYGEQIAEVQAALGFYNRYEYY